MRRRSAYEYIFFFSPLKHAKSQLPHPTAPPELQSTPSKPPHRPTVQTPVRSLGEPATAGRAPHRATQKSARRPPLPFDKRPSPNVKLRNQVAQNFPLRTAQPRATQPPVPPGTVGVCLPLLQRQLQPHNPCRLRDHPLRPWVFYHDVHVTADSGNHILDFKSSSFTRFLSPRQHHHLAVWNPRSGVPQQPTHHRHQTGVQKSLVATYTAANKVVP